jgi:hypothetical protein
MMIYQNMKVWEKSHKLTLAVYAATARLSLRRALRPDQPAPARRSIGSSEHR